MFDGPSAQVRCTTIIIPRPHKKKPCVEVITKLVLQGIVCCHRDGSADRAHTEDQQTPPNVGDVN